MASDEHVALLKQGVAVWNEWRLKNPDIRPDLSEADLKNAHLCAANLGGRDLTEVKEADFIGADLRGADLRGADLRGADFSTEADLSAYLIACYNANLTAYFTEEPTADTRRTHIQIVLTSPDASGVSYVTYVRRERVTGANLSGADLRQANLSAANLRWADLSYANMVGANLREAKFREADLRGADLSGVDLSGTNLFEANLGGANLSEANLGEADLTGADLGGADLRKANLGSAKLWEANLTRANLTEASLRQAYVSSADLSGADLNKARLSSTIFNSANLTAANLTRANLFEASLFQANLTEAKLTSADLFRANLTEANLTDANLTGAVLRAAILISTNLTGADLTGCVVYGVSAWGLKLERTKQENLVITPREEAALTVDNIEVAQFIYLLLHNQKIRDVIDTIGKKGVLLLGRFTEGRIAILERLREKLRGLGYVPMVFNFDKPETKDFTETVRLLANLSRFVIVDITNPRSTPLELQATVPDTMVPFVPILQNGEESFAMFVDLKNKYDWVLKDVIVYPSVDRLIEVLEHEIIGPAEAKFSELLSRRTEQLRLKKV